MSFNFTIDINPERNLMVAKIYGIWKKETAEAYHEEYKKTAEPFLGKRWAKLTNLTNWKSSYPEIVDVLSEHMHWCQENGAVYSVYIIDNPVTHSQLSKMIKKGDVSTISKIFRTYDEGDRFLKQNGF
ncbi:MAG: hypothetical protein DRP51_05475 [Candidatus Zixiibacteriota bacterium]|nr:MAG: hypothetical protein DRP51_05475 [candidate division Zixibacteria bacterium]